MASTDFDKVFRHLKGKKPNVDQALKTKFYDNPLKVGEFQSVGEFEKALEETRKLRKQKQFSNVKVDPAFKDAELEVKFDDVSDSNAQVTYDGDTFSVKLKKSKKRKSTGKAQMANKFLPFVVESSSPLNIYQTLLSRSKGMERSLIASIFNIALNVDIDEVRQYAASQPDMPTQALYNKIVEHWDAYRITPTHLEVLASVGLYATRAIESDDRLGDFTDFFHEKLAIFNPEDIMLFLAVLAKQSKPDALREYTKLSFDLVASSETRYQIMKDVQKYMSFSDEGERQVFGGPTELKYWLLYKALIEEEITGEKDTKEYCVRFEGYGYDA